MPMKKSFIVKMSAAVVFATLASIGLATAVPRCGGIVGNFLALADRSWGSNSTDSSQRAVVDIPFGWFAFSSSAHIALFVFAFATGTDPDGPCCRCGADLVVLVVGY